MTADFKDLGFRPQGFSYHSCRLSRSIQLSYSNRQTLAQLRRRAAVVPDVIAIRLYCSTAEIQALCQSRTKFTISRGLVTILLLTPRGNVHPKYITIVYDFVWRGGNTMFESLPGRSS